MGVGRNLLGEDMTLIVNDNLYTYNPISFTFEVKCELVDSLIPRCF
jgi:hypothetical protein